MSGGGDDRMSGAGPTPRRILLVGGGGREHALAWRLGGEPGVTAVLVVPGSAAIGSLPGVEVEAGVSATDAAGVVAAARRHAADLVVIGPEAPLAAGVADALRAVGFAVFGPDGAAARVEASKAFCHEVAAAAGIPMAKAAAFAALAPARAFAAELARAGGGVVVKADGLASGKGVTVCDTVAEADAALAAIFATSGTRGADTRRTDDPGSPGADAREPDDPGTGASTGRDPAGDAPRRAPRVVVEERLRGPEASVIAVCDGIHALALPAARDHKRLGDGDTGPNTGGMGAFSPLPDLDDAAVADVVARFHRPALAELARRGTPFRGALYAGLILTADRGAVLLEFNARFGDPETQAILPRVATPLGPLLLAAANGRLAAAAAAAGLPGVVVPAFPEPAVAIVLASRGYPGTSSTGDPIAGLDAAAAMGALVFHAGTRPSVGGGWETNGGRVIAVVGRGPDLAAARAAAEAGADAVTFAGAQRRHDIASAAVAAAGASAPGRPPLARAGTPT